MTTNIAKCAVPDPNGIGYMWNPGHPTEEDLQVLVSEGIGKIEELRVRFSPPSGHQTLGDHQAVLGIPTPPTGIPCLECGEIFTSAEYATHTENQ